MNIEKIEIEFDGDKWTAHPIPYLVVGTGQAYGCGATPELAIQALRWAFEQCREDRQIVANIPCVDYTAMAVLYVCTVRDNLVAGYGSPIDLKAFCNPAPINGFPMPLSHVVMDGIMAELKAKGARVAPGPGPSEIDEQSGS